MKFLKRRKVGLGLILGLVIFLPIAHAQTPYDITDCGSMTFTVNSASEELTIITFDFKGIARSNSENKVFDNSTFHVVVILKTVDGKRTSNSYWKIQDPDGDVVIAEVLVVGPEKTMTFLHGTGKWKGIKGGGKGKTTVVGKSVVPGTVQSCSRYVGTFELAK